MESTKVPAQDMRGLDIYERHIVGRTVFALAYSWPLLHQAGLALSVQASMGASLLCRAAIDAAAYDFYWQAASLEPGVGGRLTGDWRTPPLRENSDYVDMGCVRAAVQRAAALDAKLVAAWKDVKVRGDLGAHPAERIARFFRDRDNIEKRVLRTKGVFVPTEHIWVDADHALEDIRATAEILAVLEDLLARPVRSPGSQG